jgi:O-antigen/teichoic acid export membrane protein
MFQDIRKVIGKSAIYSLGNLSTKLIGLILIPLYTDQHYFTIQDYGALSILEITSQVLVALLSLNMSHSFTRWYWDANYKKQQKSMFFTVLVMLIFLCVLSLTAALPLSEGISRLLLQDTSYSYIIQLVFISSIFQILINHIQTLQKLQSRALMYSLVSIIKLSLSLLFTLYFIIYKGKKIDGIYEAQIIGSLAVLLMLIPYTIRSCSLRFERKVLNEMLIYSYPLMLASVTGVLFSVIDRYSLNYLEGLEKVGVYSLGYKIASTLKVIVIASVQLALSPLLMKKINEEGNQQFYSKVMTYFSLGLMFCVIGMSLFSLEVIKVASRDLIYWESANIVAILSFSFFFGMMKDNAMIGLHIVKKTKITGSLIILASLINLGLNMLFIPLFSIYGAAAGTMIAQILFFGLIYFAAQKQYRIPYEIKKLLMILATGTIIVTVGFFINHFNLGLRLILKTLALLSFPFILYLFGFYDPVELETIKRIFKTWESLSNLKENLKRLFSRGSQ